MGGATSKGSTVVTTKPRYIFQCNICYKHYTSQTDEEETESQNEIMVNAMDQFVRIECELVEGSRVSFNEFAAAFFHHFRVIGIKCEKCSVKSCDNLLAVEQFYSFGRGPNKIVLDIFLILELYIKKKKVAINTKGLREGGDLGCIFVYGVRIKDFEEGDFIQEAQICQCPFGVKRFTQHVDSRFNMPWHSKEPCNLLD